MIEQLKEIKQQLTKLLDDHGAELEAKGLYRGDGGLSQIEDNLDNIIATLEEA